MIVARSTLLQPKEILVDVDARTQKTFIISKFPAVEGREIIAKYPVSNLPKVGDYGVSEDVMLKLMSYVAVPMDDPEKALRLANKTLVDNHALSWEALAKIEIAMIEYNCSFFQDGRASSFFEGVSAIFIKKISEILTDLSAQSSGRG